MADTTDVVVIGGGIIGCACALELAARGIRVVLVERGELAAGASGRNHGLLLAPLDPTLAPMAEDSTERYEEVVATGPPLPVHLDPAPIGYLIVAATEVSRQAGREEAAMAEACGVQVERLGGAAARRLEPALSASAVEAWLLRDARRVDPAALTVALGLLAQAAGTDVRRHLTARALLTEGDRVRGLATDEGVIAAETVVLAAGPWTQSLLRPLGIDLPIGGVRGWLVHLAAPPEPIGRLIGEAGWHATPDREAQPPVRARDLIAGDATPVVGALIQPNPDGTVLVGGSRQWALAGEPEDAGVPREILRRAVRLIPSLTDATVLRSWWGVRPMTPDGRPVIGPLRPGLIVASGHGSQGVILGGGTAALVAALTLGGPPPFDPAPFDPARFAAADLAATGPGPVP